MECTVKTQNNKSTKINNSPPPTLFSHTVHDN